MKKQTEILTTTAPTAKRIQLIFLVVIAAVFYRNYSNRRLPLGVPPNTWGMAKQAVQSAVSELEQYIPFQFLTIAALAVLLVVAIVYIIRTH